MLDFFRTTAAEAATEGRSVVEGFEGWLFLVNELRHLGAGPFWGDAAQSASRATRPDARDPLPAILDFHAQLAALDVELVLVPVPPKALVYPDFISEAVPLTDHRADIHHQIFYERLRAEGVRVLDLTDRFKRGDHPEYGPLYCRQDSHWSGAGCIVAAELIAEMIRPMLKELAPRSFDVRKEELEIRGDLWHMLGEPERPRERIALRVVEQAEPTPDSPVLLIGDSHTLVFHAGGDMHARRAGLADQLAVDLGIPVDLIGVRGSGATPARINLFRRAQRDPDVWEAKQVVVWVFSAREFTETDGWRKVPIAP